MANQLTMATVHSILTLHQRGWSNRRIARALGIHRKTVGRYVKLAVSEPSKVPTNPPPGSEGIERANSPPGPEHLGESAAAASSGPASACEPLREVILAKLEQGLSGQRIWQDLVVDHNFDSSYDSVKRFVRRLGKATPLPFRRMQCAPGEQAQVDFGRGVPIVGGNGRRRGCWVFRIVLSHSRKGYSEAVFRQSTDAFLQALEDGFWSFGGVPRTIVIDNLKAAVKKADWAADWCDPRARVPQLHAELHRWSAPPAVDQPGRVPHQVDPPAVADPVAGLVHLPVDLRARDHRPQRRRRGDVKENPGR